MKSLYNYIVEKFSTPSLGSLAFMDLDDFVLNDLEQICSEHSVDLSILDKGPTGEGPYQVEIYPSIATWQNKNFRDAVIKLGNELNPSGKMCNISFLNVNGFKYEALINYLRNRKFTHTEECGEGCFQVFEVITSKDLKEFINILDNVNESRSIYENSKESFKEEWEKMLANKTPMFDFPNGSYVYINYNEDDDTLETGDVTNSGFKKTGDSVSIDVDYSKDLDWHLQGLYDMISEEHPEWFDDEEE